MNSFRTIAAVLFFLGIASYAQAHPIPHLGAVNVSGNTVTVSFYLDETNRASLQPVWSEDPEYFADAPDNALFLLYDKALDINLSFDSGYKGKVEDIKFEGLQEYFAHRFVNRIYNELPVVARDITWNKNWPGALIGTQIFVRPGSTNSDVSALVMRAEHLEVGKWYTVRFILESPIPDNTRVSVNITPMQDEQGLFLTIPISENPPIDPVELAVEAVEDLNGSAGTVMNSLSKFVNIADNYKILRDEAFVHAFINHFGRAADVYELKDQLVAVGGSIRKIAKANVVGITSYFAPKGNLAEHVPYGNISHDFRPVIVRNGVGYICWNMNGFDYGSQDACQSSYISLDNDPSDYPGGGSGGNSEDNATPEQDTSGQGDSNLSINTFQLAFGSRSDESNYQRVLSANPLPPGGCTYFHGKTSFRNKGSGTSEDIDVDYRVDHGRNFDTDDEKIDEDTVRSLSGGREVTKYMGTAKVCASYDGSLLHLYDTLGTHLEDYPAEADGTKDIYYFIDIEDKLGDDDISSDSSKDKEYGKLTVKVGGNPLEWRLRLSQMESGSTRVGDRWTLRYTISNDLAWQVRQPIVIDYYLDDQFYKAVTIPALRENESRQISISGRETTAGSKSIKACLSINRNQFPLSNPGACTPIGTLTVNPKPIKPTGSIWGGSCNSVSGRVQDQSRRNLYIHIYDQGGMIGSARANTSGYFTYYFPQSQMDAKRERIRVYALDDRVGGYAGNPQIGSFVRDHCYPANTTNIVRATNLRSQSHFHTTNHNSLNGNSEWRREGVTFRAYSTRWVSGTRLIYFNWSNTRRSHVPSTSSTEGVGGGYSPGHATFRCPTRQLPGTRPLWRMYNSSRKAHRVAQDAGVIRSSERSGYRKEGILCYVWPVPQN